MNIVGLQAENFKHVKSINIEIPQDTNEIQIIGGNDQGKSSFMDSVAAALGGAKSTVLEQIRHGEEKATIVVKLYNGEEGLLTVTKVFRKDKKPSLIIKSDDKNVTFNSPQEVLDGFIGALSFDPTEFFNMKPEKQYDTLKDMLGLNEIDTLEAQNKVDFDKRTNVNRELKNKQTQINAFKFAYPLIEKLINTDLLVNKLQKINDKNQENNLNLQKKSQILERITEKVKQLKKLQQEIDQLTVEHHNIQVVEFIDGEDIKKEIKEAGLKNNEFKDRIELKALTIQIETLEKESTALTANMDKRSQKKFKLLSDTKMPILGLTLNDKVIRYNDTILQDCATSEKMKISFGIAASLNPNLKVIFLRNAALVDKKNLAVIRDLAKEKGYVLWLELIESGIKGKGIMQVIIEDGEIV